MKDMGKVKDLTGKKFGRLTVIGLAETSTRKTYWICQCDCGNLKRVRSDSLQAGLIRSCGCLKKEQDETNLNKSEAKKKFNHAGFKVGTTRLYSKWQGIKARCNNPNNSHFYAYGGRGIKMCEEWENDFLKFYEWSMKNGYREELTIDRIDNDGNYSPDNCRWTDNITQCNNRRSNIKIKIGNAEKTLTQWCRIFELDYVTILGRYHRHENISLDELFRPDTEVSQKTTDHRRA
jgi:hypothetical protein